MLGLFLFKKYCKIFGIVIYYVYICSKLINIWERVKTKDKVLIEN